VARAQARLTLDGRADGFEGPADLTTEGDQRRDRHENDQDQDQDELGQPLAAGAEVIPKIVHGSPFIATEVDGSARGAPPSGAADRARQSDRATDLVENRADLAAQEKQRDDRDDRDSPPG